MGRVALTSRRRLILLTFEAPLLARFGDFHSPRGISGLSKGEGRGKGGTDLAAREAHGDDAEVPRLGEEFGIVNVGMHG